MTIWIRRAALAALLVVPFALVSTAAAASTDEAELAARFAPVVRLVNQPQSCGPGEPYVPIDVNLLFDEPTVALRGPWGAERPGQGRAPAPTTWPAACTTTTSTSPATRSTPDAPTWTGRVASTRVTPPTVYAHVSTDPGYPGQLALQYWMFYVFNDWNNLHEGDWEMIQLNFHASDAAQALHQTPAEVGYSQHEGAERSSWDDPKLQLVGGTHPVVYPADGSHANFYGEALYLGASGSQGVGCDDTRNAGLVTHPAVQTIPSDPSQAAAGFPWIGFQGRWGEQQPAFFNGPTGPNLKEQWTEPIRWSQSWRDRAYAVPVGGAVGTRTTDFFCAAMAGGSRLLGRAVSDPWPTIAVVLAALALVAYGLRRATWRPTAPLRLAHRRAWGQILSAAARMYASRLRLFIGIGVLILPVSVAITILQAIVLHASSLFGIEVDGEAAGAFVLVVVAIGTALTLLGLGVMQAATALAMIELDEGRSVRPIRAYRMALRRLWPVLGAIVIAVVVISVMIPFLFLIPVAIWLAVRWALVVPVVVLEGLGPLAAIRRSSRLVRGDWLKVGSLTIVSAGITLALGPLIGTALIVLTSMPLGLLNLIAGVVYMLTMPFIALTTMYVYLDTRVGEELRPPPDPSALPAQIELSAT